MFVRTVIGLTLFTSLLGAAEPSNSDIFNVRSFLNPKTKAKIPITGQLFVSNELPRLIGKLRPENEKCFIPLQVLKPPKTNDAMAKPVGPIRDSSSVMAPLLPTCQGWY